MTSENKVVVVSVQYRLAVAGFLSLAALRRHDPRGTAGNYRLLDSIAVGPGAARRGAWGARTVRATAAAVGLEGEVEGQGG